MKPERRLSEENGHVTEPRAQNCALGTIGEAGSIGLKADNDRDPAYLRLASDLRFEAKRAERGEVVDEVKGVPAGKTHGSYHEKCLKTSPAYRDAYAKAMFETADLAEMRGELGAPKESAESNANTVRDPHGPKIILPNKTGRLRENDRQKGEIFAANSPIVWGSANDNAQPWTSATA
jgi:hypothetical protein